MKKKDTDCECLHAAAATAAIVFGICLIAMGAWWGWITAAIGVFGLIVEVTTQ